MRALCRGWFCGASKDFIEKNEELQRITSNYKNESLNASLYDALQEMIEYKFIPALCASGVMHLFGIGGFEPNLEKSRDILQGSDFWNCHEGLAFHPLLSEQERSEHLKIAAAQGSVLSMLKLALSEDNITVYRHLLFSSAGAWYRKRRGGVNFAKRARKIFTATDADKAWMEMYSRASAGHLPSAVWIVDGFLNGKFKMSEENISKVLRPVVTNGPWKFDVNEILLSKDEFNKSAVLEYMAHAGDEIAQVYLSYPSLYQ